MRGAPARRAVAAVLAATTLGAGLAACSPAEPEAAPVVADLAAALAAGTPEGVAWEAPGTAEAQVEAVFAEVGDVPRHVDVATVGEPYTEGDERLVDAELAWRWDLGAEDWAYPSEVTLVLDEEADAWTVRWRRTVVAPELAEAVGLAAGHTPAERGDVLGADGRPIVVATPVLRVGIDKVALADPEAQRTSAEAVATLVGWEDPAAFAEQVLAAGPRAFVEAITVREGVVDLAALDAIPGATALPDELPLAPTAEFARPLLGRAGPATAEIVEETEGAVRAGELTGLSGLQRTFDELLRGQAGTALYAVDATGERTPVAQAAPQPGEDLVLTLDVDLQGAAESLLAGVPTPAALVALRPSTGAVLAAASGPAGGGLSTATTGQYAPGSTFKVVSTLALLRAGLGPQDEVSCPPTATVDGYEFENYPEYPAELETAVPLSVAFAHSCNTSFVTEEGRLGPADVAAAGEALGLGTAPERAWPAFFGSVPTDVDTTAHAAALIGQGEVLASPLAMATVAASVAAGHAVRPVLLAGPEDVAEAPEAAEPAAPLSAAEAETLRTLMRGVVEDGTAAALADVPGEPVLAKTGTAEHGAGADYRLDAWTVAVQGDLAVAVLVEGGGTGAEAAVPIVEAFLRG